MSKLFKTSWQLTIPEFNTNEQFETKKAVLEQIERDMFYNDLDYFERIQAEDIVADAQFAMKELIEMKKNILKEPLLWNSSPQMIEAFENALVDEFLPRAQRAMIEGKASGYCVHGA